MASLIPSSSLPIEPPFSQNTLTETLDAILQSLREQLQLVVEYSSNEAKALGMTIVCFQNLNNLSGDGKETFLLALKSKGFENCQSVHALLQAWENCFKTISESPIPENSKKVNLEKSLKQFQNLIEKLKTDIETDPRYKESPPRLSFAERLIARISPTPQQSQEKISQASSQVLILEKLPPLMPEIPLSKRRITTAAASQASKVATAGARTQRGKQPPAAQAKKTITKRVSRNVTTAAPESAAKLQQVAAKSRKRSAHEADDQIQVSPAKSSAIAPTSLLSIPSSPRLITTASTLLLGALPLTTNAPAIVANFMASLEAFSCGDYSSSLTYLSTSASWAAAPIAMAAIGFGASLALNPVGQKESPPTFSPAIAATDRKKSAREKSTTTKVELPKQQKRVSEKELPKAKRSAK